MTLPLSVDGSHWLCMGNEMHCGSVRPFGSVGCVKKLRNVQLFRLRRIRRPIRSLLCKYTPRVSWIHFAITSRKKQEKYGRFIILKKCGIDRIVLVTCCLCHLLYLYSHITIVAGSDLIGCSMRLQRLIPYTSDPPSAIRRRTHAM